jgi:hypothetical protein
MVATPGVLEILQAAGAALMRGMNIEDEAQFVESALQRANRDMVLVQDRDTRICWRNGQLLKYRASKCRRITAMQLVRIAPARRIMEILK